MTTFTAVDPWPGPASEAAATSLTARADLDNFTCVERAALAAQAVAGHFRAHEDTAR